MNIESKTNKLPKKGKGSSRLRKKFSLQEIENRKRALKEISKEDLEGSVEISGGRKSNLIFYS
ncbi:hypothetical protein oki361_18000 [Helicobacter pylori]